MDLGPNKAGGPLLEGLSESTRKGLNEQIKVDPTTSNFPKMWTQSTGSTWKRSGGKHKSALHEVPIFTITGSKRSNDTFMVDTAEWEINGKRVRSNTVKSNFEGKDDTAEADAQPR
jgi:hypothetical protein